MNVFSKICFIDSTDWMTLLEAPLENNDLPQIKKKVCNVKEGGWEGEESCVDKGEVFNHSVIKMKARGPHKWHCLNCLHFNSFHCLAWMCKDYTGGSPGLDLYSLSKCNFLSNPRTFTDGLLKPLISLRVRWPQRWCNWMPISDKIQEEYHQNWH